MTAEPNATPAPQSPPAAGPSVWRRYGPPVVVWLLAAALLRGIAWADGLHPFDRKLFARWDSFHYMEIARIGYRFYPSDGTEGWPVGTWLGNAGWMPGYPLLMRVFLWLGVSTEVCGTLISAAFCLAMLVVLWQWYLTLRARPGVAVLCVAAFFPVYVYCFAIFPVSMAAFFAVVALRALSRNQWRIAGAAGALMAFTYPTGFLMSLVAGLWVVVGATNVPREQRPKALLIAGGLPWLGIAAVCVKDYVLFRQWDAFFLVQQKYGHGLHNPIGALVFHLRIMQVPELLWFAAGLALLIVAVLVVCATALGVRHWRLLRPVDQLLLIYLGMFWLFPLLMGPGVSPFRATTLLLPASGLAMRLPAAARWLLVALFLIVGLSFTILFFRSGIV